MGFKSVLISFGLLVIIQSVQSDKIVFRSNSTVNINVTQFNELNCTFRMPLKKLCQNITEVTCLEKSGILLSKSCQVTTENSIFSNKFVLNESLICNENRNQSLKGNCYLTFKPEVTENLTDAMHFKVTGYDENNMPITKLVSDFEDKDPFDDPFFKRNQDKFKDFKNRSPFDDPDWFEKERKKQDTIGAVFLIVFAIVFGFIVFIFFFVICGGICKAACPNLFKSTPITSEYSRRSSFPRTNYTIATAQTAGQSGQSPVVSQFAYPVSNSNFNSNGFNDPPPNYSNYANNFNPVNKTAYDGYLPPNYSSLGQANKAYVPESLPVLNTPNIPQGFTQPPSAPEKF